MEVKERSIHIHPELFYHSVKPRHNYSLFVKLGVCASILLKELNVLNFCFGQQTSRNQGKENKECGFIIYLLFGSDVCISETTKKRVPLSLSLCFVLLA